MDGWMDGWKLLRIVNWDRSRRKHKLFKTGNSKYENNNSLTQTLPITVAATVHFLSSNCNYL
jgi:hypothetical protein